MLADELFAEQHIALREVLGSVAEEGEAALCVAVKHLRFLLVRIAEFALDGLHEAEAAVAAYVLLRGAEGECHAIHFNARVFTPDPARCVLVAPEGDALREQRWGEETGNE